MGRKMRVKRNPIKVLMTKTSLDGHWRGVAIVTAALRDAGMEVIYGGKLNPYQTIETAIQEDVDVVGLSIGGRYYQVKLIMNELQKRRMDDVLVVAGGTIPREDIPLLKEMGIAQVFPPGSSLDSIISFINENVKPRKHYLTSHEKPKTV